jgi:hypothetical protein
MKLPLKRILEIGYCMKRIEACGLSLAPPEQMRWVVARKRIWEFVDPFVAGVREDFAKEQEQTAEAFQRINDEHFRAIDGEEVEIALPAPIRSSAIRALDCKKPEDYDAAQSLLGTVFAEEASQNPNPEGI